MFQVQRTEQQDQMNLESSQTKLQQSFLLKLPKLLKIKEQMKQMS